MNVVDNTLMRSSKIQQKSPSGCSLKQIAQVIPVLRSRTSLSDTNQSRPLVLSHSHSSGTLYYHRGHYPSVLWKQKQCVWVFREWNSRIDGIEFVRRKISGNGETKGKLSCPPEPTALFHQWITFKKLRHLLVKGVVLVRLLWRRRLQMSLKFQLGRAH